MILPVHALVRGRVAAVAVTSFERFTPRHHGELERERADIERFLGRPVGLEIEE